MRIYNFDTNNIKQYCKTIQYKADSLSTYRDLQNPNYIIINKTNGLTTYDLYNAGILKIVFNETKYESTGKRDYFYIIRPNFLKEHRGIINTYGSKVKLFFDKLDMGTMSITTALDQEDALEIFKFLGSPEDRTIDRIYGYRYNSNTDYNLKLGIYEYNKTSSKYAIAGTQDFKVVYLDGDLEQPVNIIAYNQDGMPVNKHEYKFYDFPQGYIIFCNVTEDEEPVEKNSKLRRTSSTYSLIPASAASGYYLPSGNIANGQIWSYVDKGTDSLGTSAFINIDFRQLRFAYKTGDITFISSIDESAITVEAYSTSNNNYTFNVISAAATSSQTLSAASGTLWTGMNANLLLHKIFAYSETSNGIIEEEIFADDSINYGSRNVDSINKPYYTVTMKHETNFPAKYVHVRLW